MDLPDHDELDKFPDEEEFSEPPQELELVDPSRHYDEEDRFGTGPVRTPAPLLYTPN